MTSLTSRQPCCSARGNSCNVHLSFVRPCVLLRCRLFRRHPRHNIKARGLFTPEAALTAADAFEREPSLGTVIKHRCQQLQQSLLSPHDKEIVAVAFPAFVGLALEPVVSAFNAGLVGHLGTQQLSAVSLGSIALNSCTFLFSFLLALTIPDIAAAVAKNDDDEVSKVASHSLWVAAGCGLVTAVAVGLGTPSIVAALRPPEPAVAAHATQYIMIRAIGIPSVLLSFVTTAVFRGFKDTKTPLLGTGASVAVSFCLHVLLLNVLHLDVVGAAIAATVASCVSCFVMMNELVRRGKLRLQHVMSPPPLSVVLPILQRGMVLATRNMVSFGMILFASTLCVRNGSAFQASFEVLRQLWMLTMPFFECLNVATQSLCATALGHQDPVTARQLLNRLLFLSTTVGALAGSLVWMVNEPIIAFFTRDPAVVAHVMLALPLVCAFFPLDAAGSIMDGSLMAAKQSNYMSAVQIMGSVVQYTMLVSMAGAGHVDTFSIWAAIKVMALTRIFGGMFGVFISRKSAYIQGNTDSPRKPDAATGNTGPVAAAVIAGTVAPHGTAVVNGDGGSVDVSAALELLQDGERGLEYTTAAAQKTPTTATDAKLDAATTPAPILSG